MVLYSYEKQTSHTTKYQEDVTSGVGNFCDEYACQIRGFKSGKCIKEQVKRQQKKLYGTSSEKVVVNQISLFDEAEVESTPIADESTITVVKALSRKKKTRQLDVDALDNRTIDYTLNEAEKSCSCCGNNLHEMSKQVRKELVFIPPKVEVINHVEHIYSCRTCETKGTEATIVKAKSPRPLIKGSMASASLVSNIIADKYDKAIPLYRQEVSFQRLGINLNRQNMSNWLLKVSNSISRQ